MKKDLRLKELEHVGLRTYLEILVFEKKVIVKFTVPFVSKKRHHNTHTDKITFDLCLLFSKMVITFHSKSVDFQLQNDVARKSFRCRMC